MSNKRYSVNRTLLMSSVALAAMSGFASGADLAPTLKAPPPAVLTPLWYIEVEAGSAIFNDPNSVDPGIVYGCPPINCSGGFYTETLFGGGGPFVGARIGYHLSPMFRADFLVGYMTSTVTGHIDYFPPGPGNPVGVNSLNATRRARAFVEMVNGYVELDSLVGRHWGRWHPYVTAGLGAAEDHLGSNCVSCDFGTRNGSNTTTQFAWAAGLGTQIDLFPDVKLDIAYRYYDLGKFTGGNNGNMTPPSNFTGNDSFRQTVNVFTGGVIYPFTP
jgi:opacity protein-like surface antigen